MTKLSVNINKIATLRNARGGNNPDVVKVALDCERFGAEGITVHPRPDERHIRYQDVLDLKSVLKTEFNIEGYPDERYMELVEKTRPAQATLVPDPPNVLTSNAGWDTMKHLDFLKEVVKQLNVWGVRSSIFIETDKKMIEYAAKTGVNRVELYTEAYAKEYLQKPDEAVTPYVDAAKWATENGLELNAGHDLDLQNLAFFSKHIPELKEVSIGHALVCDALYYGLENVIPMYKSKLQQ